MKTQIVHLDLSKINEEEEEDSNENREETQDENYSQIFPDYGSPDYWDKRYKNEFLPFDWYMQWNELEDIIKPYIPSERDSSLVIGCGNSTMSYDLKQSGYKNIVSIDISPNVITKMKKKYPDLEWIVMDVSDLKFDDNSFDIIFDKGTVDAITCADNAKDLLKKTSAELYRVLKPNGIMFMITYETPNIRLSAMKRTKMNWKVLQPIFIPNQHASSQDQGTYIYFFQKNV